MSRAVADCALVFLQCCSYQHDSRSLICTACSKPTDTISALAFPSGFTDVLGFVHCGFIPSGTFLESVLLKALSGFVCSSPGFPSPGYCQAILSGLSDRNGARVYARIPDLSCLQKVLDHNELGHWHAQ